MPTWIDGYKTFFLSGRSLVVLPEQVAINGTNQKSPQSIDHVAENCDKMDGMSLEPLGVIQTKDSAWPIIQG